MKKHKTKIIIAAVVVILLAGVWFLEGGFPDINHSSPDISGEVLMQDIADDEDVHLIDYEELPLAEAYVDGFEAVYSYEEYPVAVEDIPYETYIGTDAVADLSNEVYIDEVSEQSGEAQPDISPDAVQEESPTSAQSAQSYASIESVSPVEPEDMHITDVSFIVYLTVRVDNILHNMHLLDPHKHELIPADGIIFPLTAVTAYEGESVFNVLQREMRRARIHMESRFTPIFNSAYVMAINNIYEFDAGELSGWMYKVDGWFPNFGSSRYLLSPGNVIEWHFTVDLGRDLGQQWIGGLQQSDD